VSGPGSTSTLRSLVERVRAAPDGPSVAAVFDYDGTLIDGFSGLSFVRERFRRRQLSPTEAAKIAQAAIRGVRTPEEFSDFLDWSLQAYAGRDVAELSAIGQDVLDDDIAGRLRPETWALLETHRVKGHTLVLASSGTSLQLEAIAAATGVEHVVCTRLEVVEGRMTGRVDGQPPWGPFKAAQVLALLADLGVALADGFAYSDGDEDIPLLAAVAHPAAISPRPALRREARRQRWPVLDAEPVGGALPITAPARTAAMYSGFAGGTALAGPIGLLRRSTRAFVDTTIGLASDLSLGLGGVKVDLVEGERHLTSARPCVFVFNHRSNLDAIVLMHLLRRDITAVAKQEVADIPGFGQLFRMADVAFIDRSDSAQARAAIQPAIDRIRGEGLSLVLAPEGTRWPTPGIGPFRKGAFHIARQAGVPVVPVVLAGAGERLPKGTQMIRPGTVRVAVLPPVDVGRWAPEELGQRVAEVRGRMLEALVELIAG
jgi:putative phosphoserine phosphatase/1-acylglycerol-3-phosphate O-acyltransferase